MKIVNISSDPEMEKNEGKNMNAEQTMTDVFLKFIDIMRNDYPEEMLNKFEEIIKNPQLAKSFNMNGFSLTKLADEDWWGFTMWIKVENGKETDT